MAKEWICTICGYVAEGEEAPAKCPQCGAPASKFKELDQKALLQFVTEHEIGVAKGCDEEMIKVGALVPMMTADGYRINGLVKEVGAEKVKLDFNHPLAGKSVRFDGKILAVRDATPEELQPVHGGCGCGCDHDHDHCGDHDDCDCDGGHHGDGHCGCGDGCCH